MKKKNIGRTSAILMLINAIFIFVNIAEKNDLCKKTETNVTVEATVHNSMKVFQDETVDGNFTQMLENIINDNRFAQEHLAKIDSYEWYITDNLKNTESYKIYGSQIIIYADETDFRSYVETVLKKILEKGEL